MKNDRIHSSPQKWKRMPRNGLFLCLLICLTFWSASSEMEATWTPNPDDDGPLPLSQSQRQQLMQLEQAIVSSPDPQSTLNQVAEANGMDPQELVNLLQRNRQDLEAAGGMPAGRRAIISWPQKILKLLGSLAVVIMHAFQRNPKFMSLFAAIAMLLSFTMFSAPRTGLVISSGRSLWSKGHTTVWNPPQKYVANYMESPRFDRKSVSLPQKMKGRLGLNDLPRYLEKDGVEWHKLHRKSDLVQATTAQRTIHVEEFVSEKEKEESDEEEEDDDDEEEEVSNRKEQLLEMIYDAAATVLSSRRLTEFVDDKSVLLQSNTEGRRRSGMLVVKRMGDWGRYGLQPVKLSNQQEGDTESSLTYSTLKGGHFDGQIRITVIKRDDDGEVCIQVRIVVPKKGRKLNKKLAHNIVSNLADSIKKSTMMQTKQTLVRQSQGKRYRGKAHSRAAERRRQRFENEKKQEEMARDRRRKWQRQNPDAGHYRPSGERMRSPNFTT